MSTIEPLKEMPYLHARRLQARRRRYLLRMDLGLGVLIATVALLLAPGVAIVAVAALLVLAICIVAFAFGRWRSR